MAHNGNEHVKCECNQTCDRRDHHRNDRVSNAIHYLCRPELYVFAGRRDAFNDLARDDQNEDEPAIQFATALTSTHLQRFALTEKISAHKHHQAQI